MNVTTCFTYQHSSHKTCFLEANPNRPPPNHMCAWFFSSFFHKLEYYGILCMKQKTGNFTLGAPQSQDGQWTVTCLLGMLRIPLNKHGESMLLGCIPSCLSCRLESHFLGFAKQSVPTTYAVDGTGSSGHSVLISWTMSDRGETSKVNCWTKLSYISFHISHRHTHPSRKWDRCSQQAGSEALPCLPGTTVKTPGTIG